MYTACRYVCGRAHGGEGGWREERALCVTSAQGDAHTRGGGGFTLRVWFELFLLMLCFRWGAFVGGVGREG